MWNVDRVTKLILEKKTDHLSAKLASKHRRNVIDRARVRVVTNEAKNCAHLGFAIPFSGITLTPV